MDELVVRLYIMSSLNYITCLSCTSVNKTQDEDKDDKDESKCYTCKKHLNYTDTIVGRCKCNHNFCSQHKSNSNHKCTFNFRQKQQELLKRTLVRVVAQKVEQI